MKQRLLILCTGNSARSQMAEGLFRHFLGDRYEVESAGSRPSRVNPLAIEAMNEIGIDISGHRSKHVSEFDGQRFDIVLTVCDHAAEVCPVFPAETRRIHWSLPDPHDLEDFREVREEIRKRMASPAGFEPALSP